MVSPPPQIGDFGGRLPGVAVGTERPSPAVQDYLKAAYRITERDGREQVSTSQMAGALGVTPASASNMLRRLDGLGYVHQVGRGAFRLTPAGRGAALEVVRHHRLLETFLVERLGVPLEDAHDEAEVLEHHLSDALEARIADVLGHPERDPHGDPIPTPGGEVAPVEGEPMTALAEGETAVVVRVSDRDADRLRALAGWGIVPDTRLTVVGRGADGLVLRISSRRVTVPVEVAGAVTVARYMGG